MIKMSATGADGRKFMVLGLSDMNLTKLREGKPIKFDGALFGFNGEVMIFWGATEGDMAKTVEPFLSPGTIIYKDRKS